MFLDRKYRATGDLALMMALCKREEGLKTWKACGPASS
jgi:hypothetical protein